MSVAKSFESIDLSFAGFHAFRPLSGSDEDGKAASTANNFEDFIQGLVFEDEFEE